VLYGSEVWQFKKKTNKKLLAVDMDFCRWLVGMSRKDKIPVHVDVIKKMGLQNYILDYFKQNNYYGTHMPKEWQTTDCQNMCWSGCHQ
jgi:hypothetical protein